MIKILELVWRYIPVALRLRIVRLTQHKFTASVVAIIRNKDGEVLILDHFIRPGSSWGLPGGFMEPEESPDQAISREIMEETGLTLQKLEQLRIRTVRRHIEILFIADGVGDVKLNSKEIRDYGWFPVDSLPEKVSKVQRELITEICGPASSPTGC